MVSLMLLLLLVTLVAFCLVYYGDGVVVWLGLLDGCYCVVWMLYDWCGCWWGLYDVGTCLSFGAVFWLVVWLYGLDAWFVVVYILIMG